MKSSARPLKKGLGILAALGGIFAMLYGLAYLGSDSPVASVRLSKDSRVLPRGVRVYARNSEGNPVEGVQFSYETHSGITESVATDPNGYAFIKQAEDYAVLGLYIADQETNRYTEIWNPLYDWNFFTRLLGILFEPTLNIEFRVELHSLPYEIGTEKEGVNKPFEYVHKPYEYVRHFRGELQELKALLIQNDVTKAKIKLDRISKLAASAGNEEEFHRILSSPESPSPVEEGETRKP